MMVELSAVSKSSGLDFHSCLNFYSDPQPAALAVPAQPSAAHTDNFFQLKA